MIYGENKVGRVTIYLNEITKNTFKETFSFKENISFKSNFTISFSLKHLLQ